jgi:hypothetical protein
VAGGRLRQRSIRAGAERPAGDVHHFGRRVATISQVVPHVPAVDDARWTRITAYQVTLPVLADTLRADPHGDIGNGEFDRWHTFYLRAVDNEGAPDETPDHRTFQAFTQAPSLWLLSPTRGPAVTTVPRTFVLHWDGNDPIGHGPPLQDPKESRWVLLPATLDVSGHPIGYPNVLYDLPDTTWTDWAAWTAADSTGRNLVVRDRVPVGPTTQSLVFAVQGRDDGGAITPKFTGDATQNNYAAILVDGALRTGPHLTVHSRQDTLSEWSFPGIGSPGRNAVVPSDTLTLYWDVMQTSHYGGRWRDYRYGWNVTNENDDQQWTAWSAVRVAVPHRLAAGGEVFKVQARDNIGQITTGSIAFQHAALRSSRR